MSDQHTDTSDEVVERTASALESPVPLAHSMGKGWGKATAAMLRALRDERDKERAARLIYEAGIGDVDRLRVAAEAERDRLREALLMWLGADDAGDGQECINAIAHARNVVGDNRA